MEYLLLISCVAAVCRGSSLDTPTPILQRTDVPNLQSTNCNDALASEPCATECGLNGSYRAASISRATFPQDGFCTVFNDSQPLYTNQDWYTVSGRICSTSSYPQGTGLLFNYQYTTDYEMVYKTSQNSSSCYIGYVQRGVIQQTDSFHCGTTTADQWHRYTVTVYRNRTFQMSLSTQAGNSTTSARFHTSYPMSTRGGIMILNDGSQGKVLQFDVISLKLSTDCNSSTCGPGGNCADVANLHTCNCYLGYTGVHCETVLPVIYFLETDHKNTGYISKLTGELQTRVPAGSGGVYEHGLAIDIKANLMFYTTYSDKSVWKAAVDNIHNTVKRIKTFTKDPRGIGLCATDQLVFVDQLAQNYTGGAVAMLNYDGSLLDTLTVAKSVSQGFATDDIKRILYFTDTANKIWRVSFTQTRFTAPATVILEGAQVGNVPAGLVLEDNTLYWIMQYEGGIRSMAVNGITSTLVVPATLSSEYTHSAFLAKKGKYFYYTRGVSDGGVYRVSAGGTREKITTSPTLGTSGIVVF